MMKYAPIDINKIRDLEADMQESIKDLRKVLDLGLEKFTSDKMYFAAAEHCFRRILEGILTVGTHILSRMPVRTKDYQDIIVELGRHGVVPVEFAERNKKLAGYRNRIVHLYWEVTPEELYAVSKEHLSDLNAFCEYYREVVRHPEKFGLEVEK